MPSDFPLQQKLFEIIADQYKNKNLEIERYTERFSLSRSAVYECRSGKVPISFDEGVGLMHEKEIPLEMLFSGQKPALLLTPTSLESAPDEYLNLLYRDLSRLAAMPSAYTWHKTDDTPIFLLKFSRLLAAFKLYYWTKTLMAQQGAPIPRFSDDWMQETHTTALLDTSRGVLHAYQSVPGTEIWSRGMFDKTIAQIEDTRDTGGFENPDMAGILMGEIVKLCHIMEKMARIGKKHPDGGTNTLTIFENRTFSGGNMLMGDAKDGFFFYLDAGYPDFIRHTDENLAVQYHQRFQLMEPHLTPVTGSERGFFAFFQSLHAHITTWTKILMQPPGS